MSLCHWQREDGSSIINLENKFKMLRIITDLRPRVEKAIRVISRVAEKCECTIIGFLNGRAEVL